MILGTMGVGVLLSCQLHKDRSPNSEAYDPIAFPEHLQAPWAIDRDNIGSQVPNPGTRSLFDELFFESSPHDKTKFVYNIPYPFDKIIEKIYRTLIPSSEGVVTPVGPILSVMFPRGRSLQRQTQWHAPRVVLTVNGDPKQDSQHLGINLKNRLYLGFSEVTGILEVISYNEKMGRFEFQVVKGYKPNEKVQVTYADRNLCLQCHQNQSPIFSLAGWSESNANSQTAAALQQNFFDRGNGLPQEAPRLVRRPAGPMDTMDPQTLYYGIPLFVPLDMPYKMDLSTDDANLMLPYQTVWRELCKGDRTCRVRLLKAVFQYLLTNQLTDSEKTNPLWLQTLAKMWMNRWPNGLNIPNPNIPNRDPFRDFVATSNGDESKVISDRLGKVIGSSNTSIDSLVGAGIPYKFEPLIIRNPIYTWRLYEATSGEDPDFEDLNGVVIGLSKFFTAADVGLVDEQLNKSSAPAHQSLPCSQFDVGKEDAEGFTKINFECKNSDFLVNHGNGPGAIVIWGTLYFKNGYVADKSKIYAGADNQVGDCNSENLQVPTYCNVAAMGTIITLAGSANQQIKLQLSMPAEGRHFRFGNGLALNSVAWQWTVGNKNPTADLTVVNDYENLGRLLDGFVSYSGKEKEDPLMFPFQRANIMVSLLRGLGSRIKPWDCCGDVQTAVVDTTGDEIAKQISEQDSRLGVFFRNCKQCHFNTLGHPPNWLYGKTPEEVWGHIRECQDRIFYKISMWDNPPNGINIGTPVPKMPPEFTIHEEDRAQWDADRAQLRTILAGLSRKTVEQKAREILPKRIVDLPRCQERTITEGGVQ